MNQNIKLLVIDLDNTLLKDDKTVSKEDLDTLKKCLDSGIGIIVASGRFPFSHRNIVKNLNLGLEDRIHIANGGGTIYKKEKEFNFNYMDHKDVKNIKRILDDYEITPFVTDGEYIFYEKKGPLLNVYKDLIKSRPELFKKIDNIEDLENVQKFIIFIPDDKTFEELKKLNSSNIKTFIAAKQLAEITSKDLDKWTALELILKEKGLNRENVLAIGDSGNDLEIIKNSGIGCAVANSLDELKEVADFVAKNDNNNSAVTEIVEKCIFNYDK